MSILKSTGTSRNDLIDRRKATTQNHLIDGGAGNDTLYGSKLDDTLIGGAGDDAMYGGAGNDLYMVNSAKDSVIETATGGNDTIDTTLSIDLTASASRFQNVENLIVNAGVSAATAISLGGNAAANKLTGHAGADSLMGYAGNDTLIGLAGDDLLDGGDGNDSLQGGAGNDRLVISKGSDVLAGDAGSDTYVLSQSVQGARVTLTDTAATGDVNTLVITDGSTKQDLWVSQAGNDLRIDLLSKDEVITVKDWFSNPQALQISRGNADGSGLFTLDAKRIQDAAKLATAVAPGARGLSEVSVEDQEFMSMVMNTLWVAPPPAPAPTPAPSNFITGSAGDDTLTGNGGHDEIKGGAGNDLIKVTPGYDRLIGGVGNDTYLVNGAYMGINATIDDQGAATGEVNTLLLADGSDTSELWFSQDGNNLRIDNATLGEVITVKDWFSNPTAVQISRANADGSNLVNLRTNDVRDLARLVGTARSAAELTPDMVELIDVARQAVWSRAVAPVPAPAPAPAPSNFITGSAGDDTLAGNGGNDEIKGGAGNDLIKVTPGYDRLIGGVGNDTYLVNGAYMGINTVIDDQGAATGEVNTLLLADGSDTSELWFSQDGNNLRIDNATLGEVITVKDWFSNPTAVQIARANADGSNLVNLRTNDVRDLARLVGTARSAAELTPDMVELIDAARRSVWARAVAPTPAPAPAPAPVYNAVNGTAGNDTLSGNGGNDEIKAGAGDDRILVTPGIDHLVGGTGNDTYVVGGAYMGIQSTIDDQGAATGEVNTVLLADGSDINDLWFTQEGNNLRIDNTALGEVITVKDWFSNPKAVQISRANADGSGVVTLDTNTLKSFATLATSTFEGAHNLSEVSSDWADFAQSAWRGLWNSAKPATPPNQPNIVIGTDVGDDLMGAEGADSLMGLGGDDFIFGGLGNDTLVGGRDTDYLSDKGGADLYVMGRNDGLDFIQDTGLSTEVDTLRFTDTSINDLWFTSVDGTLIVNVLGTNTSARVLNWENAANQIEQIQVQGTAGTATLSFANLQELVSVMAGFAQPASAASVPNVMQTAEKMLWTPPA